MSDKFNLSSKNDHEYVDVHGRDIPAVIVEKTGEVAFPLTELQQTGFGIFKKSQYAKLPTINKQFDEDFHLHMLEKAKEYMLSNKIAFQHHVILDTINTCKKQLTANHKPTPPKPIFQNRHVEELSDSDIQIHVNVATSLPKVTTPKFPRKSPQGPILKNVESPPKKDEQSQPKTNKLRLPKGKVLQKIPLEKEHDVIVTCIHKRNCIWVKDKANEELFNKIHLLVNEEAKYQKYAQKPFQLEKVYMAQDEGCWFRCKVLKFYPLTVFFLDYGNVAEVNEIKEVSEELAQVPCMAVRLTFMEAEYNPRLEDEIRIKIIKQNEDTTYFVNVLKQAKKSDTPKVYSFFKTPPPLASLENGQTVVVVHVENGIFYLRSKECFQKLKYIEKSIQDYINLAEPINIVKVNQLVLVPDEDGKYYRGVVTLVKQNKVDVKYLDYHKSATIDKDSLRNISEQLSLEPVTYFQARRLKGFEDKDFSKEDQVLIQEIIKKRKKFAVVLDSDNSFDLFDRTYRLSEQLGQSDCPKKIRLKDMKIYKPEFTTKTYLCGYYKSSNEFSLVPSDELESYIDSVLITEMKDTEPYTPEEGEVCFCYYTDQWYRCLATRVLNDDFEVLLLDFGNVEIMKREDLRKADDHVTDVPVLALPCKLINLPSHQKVEDSLKKLIIEGELYNVDVKSIDDGKYSVEIPTVYDQIMK